MKGIGLGTGVALAGCTGNGDGDGNGGSLDGNGDDDDSGGDSLDGNGDDDDSGANVLHWDSGLPSDEQEYEDTTSAIRSFFEDRTGESLQIEDYEYEDARSGFLTGARSGQPDSIEGVLEHLTEYIEADLVEPIGDQAEALDWFDGYVDATIDAVSFQGELYALPYTGNGRALVYRHDILEELGQDPPETADEFLELGRLIKSEMDITPFNNCTRDGDVRAFQEWISHVYQHTDNLYVPEDDGWRLNIDAESLGLVFDKFYYEVWASDDPIADPDNRGTGWQSNDPPYINGNTAMIECGPWIRGWTSGPEIDDSDAATQVLDERTSVAHLPYAEGGDRGTYLEVKPVMVNAHSEQTDLGFESVVARSAPDVMNQVREWEPGEYVTPVHEDVETTLENENWMPFTEVFETARPLAKLSWGPVRQEYYPLMQEVVYGETDPYEAGETLHSNLQDLEEDL